MCGEWWDAAGRTKTLSKAFFSNVNKLHLLLPLFSDSYLSFH